MPRVSDDELRFHAKSDGPQPLQDIARELLAARAAVPLLKLLYDKWEDGDVGMSDGYRDDGTGTEDWGVTRITDQIAAWPGLGCGPDPLADFGRECQHGNLRRACNVCEVLAERTALESRLRTTAEALRAATTWAAPMRDAPKSARPAWFDDARAVLAQLEKEGLA